MFFRKFCVDTGESKPAASLVPLSQLTSLMFSWGEVYKLRSLNPASESVLGQKPRFLLTAAAEGSAAVCRVSQALVPLSRNLISLY